MAVRDGGIMASLEARVAELESQLTTLMAEREILRTLHQYCHAWDYGPDSERLDGFVEDGAITTVVTGALGGERSETIEARSTRGRAELERGARTHITAPESFFKHVMLDPKITLLDDAEASVLSYWGLWFHREGAPFLASFGRYVDHMVRCPDGRWRFRERRIEIEAANLPPGGLGARADTTLT